MTTMLELKTTYDAEEKLWRGPQKKRLFNDEMSVGEVALYIMRGKNPEDVMQISDTEGTTMTYGTALTTAIRIAQHFKKMQLTADDVVGIFAPNTLYVTPVAVAAWFNGTPFQATNCTFETSVVKHIYDFIQPKVIFCDGQYYEKVKSASESFKPLIYTLCNHLDNVPKLEDLLEPTVTEHFFLAQPLTYGPSQTMAIMVSSGTTGLPKGVCVSNRTCSVDFGFSNGSSTLFSTSTIDWSTGLFTLIANVLVGGRRLLTTKPLTPEYLLDLIVKYKINFLATNPEIMLQLSLLPNYNSKTMQSVRLIFMTGAFCSEATLKRIRSALAMGVLIYAYGSTEFGGIAANLAEYKSKSPGKIVYNVQVKIIDPATGERLGPNQIGEICASHGSRWLGYYKNPEATKNMVDAENFILTGDLGYIDDEHYLYLTGRSKDIMKFKGFQYSPQVIEDVIVEMPDVIDVCVFGVFDELLYDVPAAAVVKREGSSLSANEIMEYVRSKSEMPQKQIHYGVFFVKELPRNHNGKLLRNKIKDMCLAMETEEGNGK
ncbi:uncharacterized protein LOC135963971 [Calliphora vicina]|uniref:uncharacterized protein LOC135963971 n=1 Tax=Calliphora vicina TaxID=7373 RepID=UPI00325B7D70